MSERPWLLPVSISSRTRAFMASAFGFIHDSPLLSTGQPSRYALLELRPSARTSCARSSASARGRLSECASCIFAARRQRLCGWLLRHVLRQLQRLLAVVGQRLVIERWRTARTRSSSSMLFQQSIDRFRPAIRPLGQQSAHGPSAKSLGSRPSRAGLRPSRSSVSSARCGQLRVGACASSRRGAPGAARRRSARAAITPICRKQHLAVVAAFRWPAGADSFPAPRGFCTSLQNLAAAHARTASCPPAWTHPDRPRARSMRYSVAPYFGQRVKARQRRCARDKIVRDPCRRDSR